MNDSTPNVTLDAAERLSLEGAIARYLGHDVSVFPLCNPAGGPHLHGGLPCETPGKRPLVKWGEFRDRPPTRDEIDRWFRRWGEFNLGRPTGKRSGVITLDADDPAAIKDAIGRGVPRGPRVITGRGAQFYFRHPGYYVKSIAGVLPGMDSKGDGGFTILPPSLHKSGRRYRWEPGSENLPLPDPPAWWLEGIAEAKGATSRGLGDREILKVESLMSGVEQGRRDETIFRYACRLRADGIPIELARGLVADVAGKCRPPFDAGLAVEKVDSAYRKYEPRSMFSKLPFGVAS